MLAIRMQRTGCSGHAQFRVIVQDSRFSPKRGRVVSYLGSYNPHTKEAAIDSQKAAQYLNSGAQPSDTVARLFKKEGIKLPAWVNVSDPKKRSVRHPEKRRSTAPAQPEKAEPAAQEPSEAKAEEANQPETPDRTDQAPAETEAEPAEAEAETAEEKSQDGAASEETTETKAEQAS
jgi:small subunit ribosomal protein S16